MTFLICCLESIHTNQANEFYNYELYTIEYYAFSTCIAFFKEITSDRFFHRIYFLNQFGDRRWRVRRWVLIVIRNSVPSFCEKRRTNLRKRLEHFNYVLAEFLSTSFVNGSPSQPFFSSYFRHDIGFWEIQDILHIQ